MLNFIGTGSAFNVELGNNSAYYKWDNKILIIDCGSSIFERILRQRLLDDVDEIHVVITHTHSDHVGSLGDLVLYSYFSHGNLMEKCLTIYSPYSTGVQDVLKANGCIKDIHYSRGIANTPHWYAIDEDFDCIMTLNKHVDEIHTFDVFLSVHGKSIYYSSDTSELDEGIVGLINSDRIDYAYIDTSGMDYEGNVHLSFDKLCDTIKLDYRHKVWCMHLDKAFSKGRAWGAGFNVAEVKGKMT